MIVFPELPTTMSVGVMEATVIAPGVNPDNVVVEYIASALPELSIK